MMLDQWDWKTSAPEFVPSSSPSGPPAPSPAPCPGPCPVSRTGPAVFGPVVGAWCAPMPEPMMPSPMGPMCAAPGGPTPVSFWQGFGYENSRPSQPEPIFGKETWEEEEEEEEDYAERIRAAQLQARYEMQLRSKEEELRSLQDRLNRKEDETARMQADFERDRQGLLYNLNQLSHAVAEKKVQDRYDGWGEQGWRREKNGFERNYQGPQSRAKERKNSKPRLKLGREESPARRAPAASTAPGRRAPGPVLGAWSAARLEKFVRQTPGAMELRKLCMDELNPTLNDDGMQVFCRWLHHTFQLMREQHQIRSMQSVARYIMVWAEVSMAWNHMGDDALGRLLQALQRSQVRVRSLKFRGNRLGASGLSQICDFIHEAHFNLRDLNLSSNCLSESSGALELLKLFLEHPRYAAKPRNPKGAQLGATAPEAVKVDLSHNGLHASKVLKKIGAIPGLSLQSVRRSKSGTREWHVMKNGVPVLRLPDFEAQDTDEAEALPSTRASRAPNGNGPSGNGGPGTLGREASPPEETPEPSAEERRGENQRGDKVDAGAQGVRKSSSREGLVKVLRQQNGRKSEGSFDKLRIVEHHEEEDHPKEKLGGHKRSDDVWRVLNINEDIVRHWKWKVIEDDPDFPLMKDDLATLQEVAPPKPRRMIAPPKILQRGAPLEA